MREDIVQILQDGIKFDEVSLKAAEQTEGRLRGHCYLKLEAKQDNSFSDVMYMGIYQGEPPHYSPWIEWFSIEPSLFGRPFFSSDIEDSLLELCSSALTPGGKIFVEYSEDKETLRELNVGVPIPLTRMGFLMLSHGFTWFKDWYFPEGFNEGGQKLQGEKPLNNERRKEHMEVICEKVKDFTPREGQSSISKRADRIMNSLESV
ncbi:MAG: DUF1122 family protein [Thermoplasmata archaeon]